MKILIIEDDAILGYLLKEILETSGYEIFVVENGLDGFEITLKEKPDLVILDINLPDISGIEICKKINKKEFIPIICISGNEKEKIARKCYEAGAIDFIEKPFNNEEINIKIKNIEKFIYKNKLNYEEKLKYKGLLINIKTREVFEKNRNIELSNKEFELLLFLIKNKDRVLDREYILDNVWGYDYCEGSDRVVDKKIFKIRDKVGIIKENLKAVRGVGYKLTK